MKLQQILPGASNINLENSNSENYRHGWYDEKPYLAFASNNKAVILDFALSVVQVIPLAGEIQCVDWSGKGGQVDQHFFFNCNNRHIYISMQYIYKLNSVGTVLDMLYLLLWFVEHIGTTHWNFAVCSCVWFNCCGLCTAKEHAQGCCIITLVYFSE